MLAPQLRTILLVDDEQAVRLFVERALVRAGHRVVAAADGTEAFAIGSRPNQQIDLLITDVVMPGINGPSLAEQLWQVHPRMQVLFVSGHFRHASLPERVAADPDAFLQKPFTIDTLLSRVRERLERRLRDEDKMPTAPRTILLVEDNPDDEELTLRALSRNKIADQVVVVRDGQDAIDWLEATGPYLDRDPSDVPALILLDLKLPKIDGLAVLRRLRANPRTAIVPVVILSASNEERDRAHGYLSGANSYVQKPVDFTLFVDAVRQVGTYWMALNQPPPNPTR